MINVDIFNQFMNLFFNKNDSITNQSSDIGEASEIVNQINRSFNKNDYITNQSSGIIEASEISKQINAFKIDPTKPIVSPDSLMPNYFKTDISSIIQPVGVEQENTNGLDSSGPSFNEITFSIPRPINFPVPSYIDQAFHSPNFNLVYHYRLMHGMSNSPYLFNEHSNENSQNISPCLYSTLLIDSI